jgi:hypothetical protein
MIAQPYVSDYNGIFAKDWKTVTGIKKGLRLVYQAHEVPEDWERKYCLQRGLIAPSATILMYETVLRRRGGEFQLSWYTYCRVDEGLGRGIYKCRRIVRVDEPDFALSIYGEPDDYLPTTASSCYADFLSWWSGTRARPLTRFDMLEL